METHMDGFRQIFGCYIIDGPPEKENDAIKRQLVKGRFLSESVTNFSNCQTNMPNHYLKLEFLKLHFVCFCFAADFQANPTDISSKKSGKIQTTSL